MTLLATTMELSIFLAIIGVGGVISMSLGFPLLAIILKLVAKISPLSLSSVSTKNLSEITGVESNQVPSLSIEIIIPAHNEAANIGSTLASIRAASNFAKTENIQLEVLVAADGCTDETVQIARKYGAGIIEQTLNRGKWLTLENLLQHTPASASWVAIVDAGAIWPRDILAKIAADMRNEAIVGISPGYYNPSAGFIEKISWLIEAVLKRFENLAGGPISVHGATVFYRNSHLNNVLKLLAGEHWINDDIVIPLILRSISKTGKLVYRSDVKVRDGTRLNNHREYIRRKRLVRGNLQWISYLWTKTIFLNPIATCLALRRICRVFWAYWMAAFLLASLCFLLSLASSNSIVIVILLAAYLAMFAILVKSSHPICAVISASLLSPFYLLSSGEKGSVWK